MKFYLDRRSYLRCERKKVCSRLEDFAALAGIGVRRYRKLEQGVEDPTEAELSKIAHAINMDVWLVGDNERRYRRARSEERREAKRKQTPAKK